MRDVDGLTRVRQTRAPGMVKCSKSCQRRILKYSTRDRLGMKRIQRVTYCPDIHVWACWRRTGFIQKAEIRPVSWSYKDSGTSLVAQWIRICLPMQRTQVQALVREDPTCRGATKPVRHSYWDCTLEPVSHNYWARAPQLLKPAHLKP